MRLHQIINALAETSDQSSERRREKINKYSNSIAHMVSDLRQKVKLNLSKIEYNGSTHFPKRFLSSLRNVLSPSHFSFFLYAVDLTVTCTVELGPKVCHSIAQHKWKKKEPC